MNYTINKTDIIKNLNYSFFSLGVLSLLYFFTSLSFTINYLMVILFFLLPVFIVLFLFIDYILNSTKGIIEISKDYIKIKDRLNSQEINKKEIIGVFIYGAPSIKRKSSFRIMPFECFHYVEIEIKNKPNIYISSLSCYNLYNKIEKEPLLIDLIKHKKEGLLKQGNWINSIFLNKLD